MSSNDKARREREHDAARARRLAAAKASDQLAEQQAQRAHQRHILALGDQAIEVVADGPGVWRMVLNGKPGPVLNPDTLSGMIARHLEYRKQAAEAREVTVSAALTEELAGEITAALSQGDPAAAIMLDLSVPLGLSTAELERLVPDRPPGTCQDCRLPLPAGRSLRCAWCAALEGVRAETARPVPPVNPAAPRPRRPLARPLLLLLTWAAICWHFANHGFTFLVIPAVFLFLAFLGSTRAGGRGR